MRLLLLSLLFGASLLPAHDPISTKLTWTQEISRIVYKRCFSCHREGGPAPMPLVTYEQARPWAKAIKEEVLNRSMPPWGAVKGFGDFQDDPSLTQDEINRIAEWVEGGAPEGETAYLPALPAISVAPTLPPGKKTQFLKGPVLLLGIRPMMSVPSAQVVLRTRDGTVQPLLWLRRYRANWDRTFLFRDPVLVPKGAVVRATPGIPLEFLTRKK